jgi:hypothetical protein
VVLCHCITATGSDGVGGVIFKTRYGLQRLGGYIHFAYMSLVVFFAGHCGYSESANTTS